MSDNSNSKKQSNSTPPRAVPQNIPDSNVIIEQKNNFPKYQAPPPPEKKK